MTPGVRLQALITNQAIPGNVSWVSRSRISSQSVVPQHSARAKLGGRSSAASIGRLRSTHTKLAFKDDQECRATPDSDRHLRYLDPATRHDVQ